MKKLIVAVITLLLCAAVLFGCGTPATTPAPTTTPAPKPAASPTATTSPAATTAKPAPTTSPAATTAKPAPAPTSATPRYGGTLRYIQSTAPGSPIGWPPEAVGATMNALQICIYPLLDEAVNGDLFPLIAESYKVDANPNKPSITFQLKKNLKFHDGSPLNAQAVKWNFEKLTVGTMTTSSANWKSFDVLDDYTVRVNLTGWQNTHVRSFAGPASSLVSPVAYDTKGLDWMRWNMVGAGAFKQVSYNRDVDFKMVRFDDYFESGKPYLEGLQIIYVSDQMTSLALLKSGGGDVLGLGNNTRVAKELQDAGFRTSTAVGGTKMLIPDSMNKDSIWANPKVRMAAEYAMDKEGMAKALGYGFWDAAYQVASKDSRAYNPALPGRKLDLQKAKQLLSEAGYPSGFKSTIIAISTENKDTLMAIQANLKEVGIIVDLQFAEPPKYSTYQMGTWKDALLVGEVPPRPNFNAALNQAFEPNTPWYKSMKKPDGWAEMINATLFSAAQDPALMQKCVKALYDDATVIPVYCPTSIWVTTNKVNDAGLGARGSTTMWYAQNTWLSK